jgi:hypothetical protein
MTLIWLGWKLLDQDRALAAQRAAERRQVSAEAVVASLDRSLAEAEHWLSGDEPPEGSLRVTASSTGLRVEPANRALWVPVPPAAPETADAPFAEAELLEFRGPADRALPIYEKMAHSGEPALRAGSLSSPGAKRRAVHAPNTDCYLSQTAHLPPLVQAGFLRGDFRRTAVRSHL